MKQMPICQTAVLLVGRDRLELSNTKAVNQPDDYQMLCKVEAAGLCYSDLKLVKQFDRHVRKSKVIAEAYQEALGVYPAYRPEQQSTVPGHEAVVRVIAVGKKVTIAEVGKRYLLQPDLRWLKTQASNGSFGYVVEGALQEYVLVDERIFVSPEGKSVLVEAPDGKSASALALCEPWACVENAYINTERKTLTQNGRLLVVADKAAHRVETLPGIGEKPAIIDIIGSNVEIETKANVHYLASLDDATAVYDDVVYLGANAQTAERLFEKAVNNGLLIFALCNEKFENTVKVPVGRTHYGGVRICGTAGDDLAKAMSVIPHSGEIRENDKINVVGAGGPMGVMHVIRNVCQKVSGIQVIAGDLDANRIERMTKIVQSLAHDRGVSYATYNPRKGEKAGSCDYFVLMAPLPQLVVDAVKDACVGGVINIFAGIPTGVYVDVDLNAYIEKKLYFIGTSGSTVEDMVAVLDKLENDSLDMDLSVAAVSGLEAAIEGIRAVENHQIAGKIIVYPQCKGLGLTLLEDVVNQYPTVAEKLEQGLWTFEAEKALLKIFATDQKISRPAMTRVANLKTRNLLQEN